MSGYQVDIIRREDDAVVKATLYDGMHPEDLVLVERAWSPGRLQLYEKLLRKGAARGDWPENLHWDWSKKAAELRFLQASGFGIVCEESWEGVMLTVTAAHFARLAEDKGNPLVYIDYLEVAPWNWRVRPLGQEGRYKGVGSILCREAVKQSIDEGFHGRVGLHALPQADAFYEKVCGMTAVGRDPQKQDLLYLEFSRGRAQKFLDDGGGT